MKVTLRIQPDVKGLDQTLASLDRLAASPALIAQLLRNAVAETLLTAYRKRFLDNLEAVLSPELAKGGKGLTASAGAIQAKEAVTKAYQALAHAEATGDRAGHVLAKRQLERAEGKLITHSKRPNGGSALSTGQFRDRALEVLRTLTDASLIAMQVSDTEVELGIANVASLDAVKTPSATPKLTGHATASQLTSMWRQLEFGTGIYSRLPGAKRAGWWYGPRPGIGLELLGAQGAHAVFDAATGLPYDKDALDFEQVFAGMLGRALAGR